MLSAAERWEALDRMARVALLRSAGDMKENSASVVAIYAKLGWDDLPARTRLGIHAHWDKKGNQS